MEKQTENHLNLLEIEEFFFASYYVMNGGHQRFNTNEQCHQTNYRGLNKFFSFRMKHVTLLVITGFLESFLRSE